MSVLKALTLAAWDRMRWVEKRCRESIIDNFQARWGRHPAP